MKECGIQRTDRQGNILQQTKEEVKKPAENAIKDDYVVAFKLLLIGNSSVGKTSIVERIIKNNFSSTNKSTIGTQYCSKTFFVNSN